MYKDQNEQWLDALLTDSAVVADRGFARSVQQEIQARKIRRRAVFAGAACLWIIIAVLFLSTQAVTGIYQRVQSLLAQVMQGLPAASRIEMGEFIQAQFSLQNYVVLIALVVLGLGAVLTSQLRV